MVADDRIYIRRDRRSSGMVRQRFRKDEPQLYHCAVCGLEPHWNGAELTLQLDHIDGDCCNDEKHNLRWICPNCHTQTDTYTGRNARRKEDART